MRSSHRFARCCSRTLLPLLLLGAVAPALAQTNLALNKPAWGTTNDFSKLYAYRVTDGDLDTFWSSSFENNPWVTVDLQAHYTVNRVKVQFPAINPNPFTWTLQVLSTTGTWTDVYCEGDPAASTGIAGVRDVTFAPVRGRTFRIYIYSPGDWGTQILDFELFEQSGTKVDLNTAAKPAGAGTITRSPDNVTYTSGSMVTLTATPAAYHRFTGWSGAASGTTNPLTVSLSASKLITANFASTATTNVALNRPTSALSTDTGSNPNYGVDGKSNTSWTATVFDDNWYAVDLESNCTLTSSSVTFDATNYPKSYKLQYLANNGSWTDIYTSPDLSSGGMWSATFSPITARKFRLYMTFNDVQYTGVYSISDFKLYGTTTTNYTLATATNLSGAGTVTTPNANGYAQGGTATLTATPASGYTFTGWGGDASGATNPLSLTMSADKNVVANFQSTTSYRLTTSTSGNGSITRSPNATYYPYRSTVALTPTGNGNWWFTGWSGDVTSTANPLNLTMNSATTVMATFTTATCGKPADGQVDSWNDGQELGFVQPYNNCYNYANNTRTDTFAQPGRWSGNLLTADTLNCATTIAFSKLDGLVPTTKTAALPYGRTRICLVMDPYYDFHWYRQNANGLWSHKPGNDVAREVDESGNPITDPETADRGFYRYVCGYFSVCSSADPFTGHSTIQ